MLATLSAVCIGMHQLAAWEFRGLAFLCSFHHCVISNNIHKLAVQFSSSLFRDLLFVEFTVNFTPLCTLLHPQDQGILKFCVLRREQEYLSTILLNADCICFFTPAVLIFGLCTGTECALVLFGSSCANVWAISTAVLIFGQIAQLC